ncbi:hypothetical protein [Paenibacillus sp. MBLB4367]|uniref:hypothetical protein n=1 Tax=Paenibacillus sp. MBLB4367 TaxID=3384767 RepID=UPI003908297A
MILLPYLISILAGFMLYMLLKPQTNPPAEFVETNEAPDSSNLPFRHKASSNA